MIWYIDQEHICLQKETRCREVLIDLEVKETQVATPGVGRTTIRNLPDERINIFLIKQLLVAQLREKGVTVASDEE